MGAAGNEAFLREELAGSKALNIAGARVLPAPARGALDDSRFGYAAAPAAGRTRFAGGASPTESGALP